MVSILLSDIIYSNINHHDESILNPLSIPIVFPSFGQGLFIIFILSILRKRPFVGCFQKTTGAFRIHRTAGRHPWRPLGNGMGIPGLGTPPDWGRDEKSSLNWCKFAGWHVSTWFHLFPLDHTWHGNPYDSTKKKSSLDSQQGVLQTPVRLGGKLGMQNDGKKSCSYNMLQLIYNRLEQPWFNVIWEFTIQEWGPWNQAASSGLEKMKFWEL